MLSLSPSTQVGTEITMQIIVFICSFRSTHLHVHRNVRQLMSIPLSTFPDLPLNPFHLLEVCPAQAAHRLCSTVNNNKQFCKEAALFSAAGLVFPYMCCKIFDILQGRQHCYELHNSLQAQHF